jgi:hypothetical protein
VIVTIHQPEHLPWLGFFAKMARADLFISLDTVPFRKNYFQNRNRVLGHDGAPAWLTVPVRLQDHLESSIAEVEIAGDGRWRQKYVRTLHQRYARHPHGAPLLSALGAAVERDHTRIAELNDALIEILRDALGVTTPMVRASTLGGTGTRSELLADLCVRAGADVYLSGPSGRDYLDPRPFEQAGVEVRVHDYDHPTYPQQETDRFISHLSAVDAICNCGPDAGELLRQGSRMVPFSCATSSA